MFAMASAKFWDDKASCSTRWSVLHICCSGAADSPGTAADLGRFTNSSLMMPHVKESVSTDMNSFTHAPNLRVVFRTLFTVSRHHFRSKMSCRKDCTRKVTFQDVTVNTIVVVVDDKPILT